MVLCDDSVGKLWYLFVTGESTEPLQELFTREDPFYPVRGINAITRRILKGPPDRPSPKTTCFPLTDEWWNVFSKCWHIEPSSRPTMADVANKIEEIVCSSLVARLPPLIDDRRWHCPIPLPQMVEYVNGSTDFNPCRHLVCTYR